MTNIKPVTFGLDYDDTYTVDPVLWQTFINVAISRGHTVKMVTARGSDTALAPEVIDVANELGIKLVMTGGQSKAEHCPDVDVWIDDAPIGIPTKAAIDSMVRMERIVNAPVPNDPTDEEVTITISTPTNGGKTALAREIGTHLQILGFTVKVQDSDIDDFDHECDVHLEQKLHSIAAKSTIQIHTVGVLRNGTTAIPPIGNQNHH